MAEGGGGAITITLIIEHPGGWSHKHIYLTKGVF